MGARPMQRLIQENIKKPLAEEILFGQFSSKGGVVYVDQEEDRLSLKFKELIKDKDKVF
jgi:ATP-dependent Clp protease ATP-binding subunit ClpA